MSHPDPAAAPDTRPIEPGEVWENPVTLERAVIVELPWRNDEGRVVAELTMLLNGQRSVLRAGQQAHIEPGVWHDWWNAGDKDAIVRVEITPGERFAHMIETLFGLAREGHVNKRGMPDPLQLALFATEFSDVAVFRKPPAAVQRVVFGALAPIARRRGYRATYPSMSRTTLAPRS